MEAEDWKVEAEGKVGWVEGDDDRGGNRGSRDNMIKRGTKQRKGVKESEMSQEEALFINQE